MNIINAIFLITMYPVIFLQYYICKSEGTVKQHTLFGIRISEQWLSKEECTQFEKEYRRKMNRYLLILAFIPLTALFIPYFSISFTIWMIWLLVVIVLFMLPMATGHQKLKQLKQERAYSEEAGMIYAEIKAAGTIRTIKSWDFLLPNLLSIGMAIFSLIILLDERFALYSVLIIVFASCTPLFYGCAIWMDHTGTKVISTNSDVNINYTRATKKLLRTFWGLSIWINTLFTGIVLATVLLKNFSDVLVIDIILWGSIVYCIVILAICYLIWRKQLLLDKQYEDKMDLVNENSEQYWIGGILYYNPNDRRSMVDKTMGMGTTMNMATLGGKVLALIGIVSLLIIPISCVWIMMEEFTPISLEITDNTLIAEHWKKDYEIPANSITDVSLLQELPRTSKVSGTGMDNLLKGTFRNSEDGKFQCFLNPQNNLFIRFTADETLYYISGYDDEETRLIYKQIQ